MDLEFELNIDGTIITNRDNSGESVIELNVSDKTGFSGDTLTLNIKKPQDNIFDPKASLDLSIEGERFGSYFLDGFSDDPHRLTYQTKAIDTLSELKKVKSKKYESMTLSDALAEISEPYGLDPRIDGLDIPFEKPLIQSNESDLNLLTRLSRAYLFAYKIKNQRFIAFKKGEFPTSEAVVIRAADILTHSFNSSGRELYNRAEAIYYDIATDTKVDIKVGTGEPTFTFKELFHSRRKAEESCRAKLDETRWKSRVLSIWLKRTFLIYAESPIIIEGLGDFSGRWFVQEVNYSIKPISLQLMLIKNS